MQYLVYRQEGNLGPFTLEELQAQVTAGVVLPTDLAWHEGLAEWEPVTNFLSGVPAAVAPPPVAATAGAEATRLAYLSHEQNVRSIGTYFYFNGALLLFFAVIVLVCGVISFAGGQQNAISSMVVLAVEGVIFGLLGALTLWSAGRFRRLDRSAVVPGTIIAAIGLLSIPIGTIISGFILYLIYSEKGRYVFSDPYHSVVSATPQITWKTALWVKILVGLFILIFVSVVAISILIALGQQVKH
jgi:hypothetical protein